MIHPLNSIGTQHMFHTAGILLRALLIQSTGYLHEMRDTLMTAMTVRPLLLSKIRQDQRLLFSAGAILQIPVLRHGRDIARQLPSLVIPQLSRTPASPVQSACPAPTSHRGDSQDILFDLRAALPDILSDLPTETVPTLLILPSCTLPSLLLLPVYTGTSPAALPRQDMPGCVCICHEFRDFLHL